MNLNPSPVIPQSPPLNHALNAPMTREQKLAQVDSAAREFEGVFAAEMLKPMFEGVQTDSMFGGGKGEDVFRGMLVQQYGKILSQSGGIGLASSIKEQMIKMQEQAIHPALTQSRLPTANVK